MSPEVCLQATVGDAPQRDRLIVACGHYFSTVRRELDRLYSRLMPSDYADLLQGVRLPEPDSAFIFAGDELLTIMGKTDAD